MCRIVFEGLFRKSDGKPIEYKGRRLCLVDMIPLSECAHRFRLTMEQSNSEWRQGVFLRSQKPIEINGRALSGKVCVWHDTSPIVEFALPQNSVELGVNNVWDTGDGATDYWVAGAAMYVESISGGKRYYCNDGHMNDDLNDLIFTLEEIHE